LVEQKRSRIGLKPYLRNYVLKMELRQHSTALQRYSKHERSTQREEEAKAAQAQKKENRLAKETKKVEAQRLKEERKIQRQEAGGI
jgi:hypothetical protein